MKKLINYFKELLATLKSIDKRLAKIEQAYTIYEGSHGPVAYVETKKSLYQP